MSDWIAGALRLDDGAEGGGSQVLSYPPRLVLHTTEGGGTVQSLANFYKSSTYWPHFTADIVNRVLAQHLPLSVGGRALSHSRATETNRAHCIQVEIIGRASESPSWTHDQVSWLGSALDPVFVALGIHRNAPTFVAGGAGENAAQRMTDAQWSAFNGVCGHQHVPQNDHYDPGAFDVLTFLNATGPTPPPKDAVMPQYVPALALPPIIASCPDPHGGAWLLAASGALYAFGGARGVRGANGESWFAGRKAARLVAPSSAESANGKLVTIIDSTGHRYALPV